MTKTIQSITSFILGTTLSLVLFNSAVLAGTLNPSLQSFEANSLIKADGTYWEWGGDHAVPIQIHGLSDVEKAFSHQTVVKKDLSVGFWERIETSKVIRYHEISSLKNLVDVQSKWNDILALDSEGKVYLLSTQGRNDPNQLDRIAPLAGIEEVIAVTSYLEYDRQAPELRWAFLKKDGTVWVNKASFPAEAFEPIVALDKIIDIEQNNALRLDGTVWGWSNETKSEIGKPLKASPLKELVNVKKLKAYRDSIVAIDQSKSLWFWGATVTGYSDGTTYHYNPKPVKVISKSDIEDAFIVERSLIVLTHSGEVHRTTIEREAMPENPEFEHLISDVEEIKSGSRHIIMKKNDGSLWGWGVNKNGDLGCGDFEFMHSVPQQMQKPVSIFLNKELVPLSAGVIIKNGQSFIPLRSVFEKMGASVAWDPRTKSVVINKKEEQSSVTIRVNYTSEEVFLDQDKITLSNSPFILNNTSYLPLRFISEALGGKVEWLPNQEKILISLVEASKGKDRPGIY